MGLKELQITCKFAKKKIINDFLTLRSWVFAVFVSLRETMFAGTAKPSRTERREFTNTYKK
jgi:hypothetical protein